MLENDEVGFEQVDRHERWRPFISELWCCGPLRMWNASCQYGSRQLVLFKHNSRPSLASIQTILCAFPSLFFGGRMLTSKPAFALSMMETAKSFLAMAKNQSPTR